MCGKVMFGGVSENQEKDYKGTVFSHGVKEWKAQIRVRIATARI
jgi:hypothetical protein